MLALGRGNQNLLISSDYLALDHALFLLSRFQLINPDCFLHFFPYTC